MRYVSFLGATGPGVGVVLGPHVFPDPTGYAVSPDGEPLGLRQLIERGAPAAVPCSVQPHRVHDVRLLAPIPRPDRDVIHVLNRPMSDVVDESLDAQPRGEQVFEISRTPTWVLGPEDEIPAPAEGAQLLEFAPKLGIIIGKAGHGLPADRALDHVWGYTLLNHVLVPRTRPSLRSRRFDASVDHLCVMGPYAVTAGDLELDQLTVAVSINGTPTESSPASTSAPELASVVASVSAFRPLQVGDVITAPLTSGPRIDAAVLQGGDVITISVPGLGALTNTVDATSQAEARR